MTSRRLGLIALLCCGCEATMGPLPDGGGLDAGSDSGVVMVGQCDAVPPSVTPLYAAGPAESGPAVIKRADGVIETHGAGRVRARHEREDRYLHFESHYFEKRSFGFIIEDEVANGKSTITVTYLPISEWATPDPRTNFRAWKVYGAAGNGPQSYLFADNTALDTVGPLQQRHVITTNAREHGRPMKVGDIMEFEFGIFLLGFPNVGDTGAKSYYSDTFRYQVGVGGLTPETFDDTGLLGPSTQAPRLGGETTVQYVGYADGSLVTPEFALSQMALNIQAPHQQRWLEGRRLFHTNFATGAHSEAGNPVFVEQQGKLGPRFNTSGCSDCHVNNGRGVLPAAGQQVTTLVLKLNEGGALGAQLRPQDAPVTLSGFDARMVTLADGTPVGLQKPRFEAGRSLKASPRMPRPLVGLGLLEAIDEATVLANADEHDCDGNGISGRANLIADPVTGALRVGRFGWKAEKVSVRHQVAEALSLDLGVGTSMFPQDGKVELDDDDLSRLTIYMQLGGVVPQRGATSAQVQRGETLFRSIGCVSCHLPSVKTGSTHPYQELRGQTIRPFSDLLLHDLGPDLADDSGRVDASEWRTPPLWNIGLTKQVSGAVNLLHDGRARSVLEAVLWHGGEALPMRQSVTALNKDDREALVAFVESL
jgi:CxxC motif-containing protein (DUF1111 family)